MVRPKCCRKIGCLPNKQYFKPNDTLKSELKEIILTLDELESIRLTDFEEIYQNEAAARMSISRTTLGRIVKSAHKKIADALINGKAIRIDGGKVELNEVYRCLKCKKSVCAKNNNSKCEECIKIKDYFNNLDKIKE